MPTLPLSLEDQALLQGYYAQEQGASRLFTVLDDQNKENVGQQFSGVFCPVASVELATYFGLDQRYAASIEYPSGDGLGLESQALITDGTTNYRIVKKETNAAGITGTYWVTQVAKNDS